LVINNLGEFEIMQINIKELEACRLEVECTVEPGEILEKRGEVLKAFKKAPVPGYRNGKAPVDAIKIYYKNQIEESLKRALLEETYNNSIYEKKLRVHGAPKFNSSEFKDSTFVCKFEILTKPDFELVEYKNMEVIRPHSPMTSVEVAEKIMQDLRIRFGNSEPFSETDFVQVGDKVIIDYNGFIDNEKVESLCAQGEMLNVGSSQLEDFDCNLFGMKVGETREFDLKVSENGLPSIAGKMVHFKVTLTMGAKITPAALDDELAKKLAKKDFSELRDFVSQTATSRLAEADKMALIQSVTNILIDKNKIDVPNWMVQSEAKYLANNSKVNWDEASELDKEKFIEMSEKNLKLTLILDKIREVDPEAQIADQEVFNIIKQNIAHSQTDKNPDDIIKEMTKNGYFQILFARIKDEFVLDFIMKNIKVID
jgi:trigger factor